MARPQWQLLTPSLWPPPCTKAREKVYLKGKEVLLVSWCAQENFVCEPRSWEQAPGATRRACRSSSIPDFDTAATGPAPHRCVLEQICNTAAGACQSHEQPQTFLPSPGTCYSEVVGMASQRNQQDAGKQGRATGDKSRTRVNCTGYPGKHLPIQKYAPKD